MKIYFILIVLLFPIYCFAEINITSVNVNCDNTDTCLYYKDKLDSMKGLYRSEAHIKKTLRLIFNLGGIKNPKINVNNNELNLSFTTKELVGEIQLAIKDSSLKEMVLKNLRIKIDSYFDPNEIQNEELRIRESLRSKGYTDPKIETKIHFEKNRAIIRFIVDQGIPLAIFEIKVNTNSDRIKSMIKYSLHDLKGKNFDQTYLRAKLDEIEKELFEYGYYLISISHSVSFAGKNVNLQIHIFGSDLYQFQLKEDNLDVKQSYLPSIKDLFKRHKREPEPSLFDATFRDHLRLQAYLDPVISMQEKSFKDKYQENIKLISIKITKGPRMRIARINFKGNKNKTRNEILRLYHADAFELAGGGYLDYTYLEFFKNSLKTEYIKAGYVHSDIASAKVEFKEDTSEAIVEFDILEGPQVIVDKIHISGIDSKLENEVLETINTKVGEAFNPLELERDLTEIQKNIQERGYYFAEITNLQDDKLVTYSKNKSNISITVKVKLNKWINLNSVIIVGNKVTKESALRKKIKLVHGEKITPSKLKAVESSVSGTGLFNSVKVKPISHNAKTTLTDVIVEVIEREYGAIEIAPGYRTDLGVKLSAQVTYQNLWGLNKGMTLKGQINQRVDYQAFDQRRRSEKKSMLEYIATTQFNQADILNTSIEHTAALTFQRKRFYSFDADISRINNTFSRDLNSRLSASIRHQYESINQFDATNPRDNGSFVIGALTPILTADFRNNRINPTKGAFFNVSCEFANKYFLSQENDDLKVNFYKLISRNRFYIPYSKGTVAISLVGGIQENLSKDPLMENGQQAVGTDGTKLTEGYIPSIKVFRLSGTDIVRGFSDQEINRLSNGKDIGIDRIQDKAYMANFKLEPRYFINDTMIGGVFFDAGRVYAGNVDFGDLRQSVGVTFKFLTPVGTLDFDYGIKLLRKELDNGRLESPGRFHVSIGFF